MQHAILFPNGQSQSVLLPKESSFESDSIVTKPVGNAFVLLPYNEQ